MRGWLRRPAVAHFGLGTPERDWSDGDSRCARLMLAASQHAAVTGEGSEVHPCDHAKEAVAWDVIALARERGWYTPTEDESPGPLEEEFAAA